jgi:hypothetical protein
MSRRWLLFPLCLLLAVAFVQLSTANTGLRVNESATRFLIQEQTIVSLEVINPASRNVSVHLKLELLDPGDATRGRAARDETLKPGANKLSVPLMLTGAGLSENDDRQLPWYRLRYSVEPAADIRPAPDAATGVISLSEIDLPDVFALEVSAPRQSHRGARYFTHIRTLHPITAKPVNDVNVSVEFTFDDDAKQKTLKASGVTDADGYALVALNIPARLSADEGELKIVARHGGYVQEASHDIDLNDAAAQIMVTTDKPIYQPGQALHVRALVFNAANHAAANADATLKITDPESTNVFQTTLHTSRFGVANADWTIPENTRLGDYSINVEMDDQNYGRSSGYGYVKISRYDLPNFAVAVKPDRSCYLPQQNAEVEVRADYLFGQPVKRGHVRVVREEQRHWNFREQKWETEDGDKYEGETDDAGRFVAHIDLKKDHQELADEDYSRFTDLHYAAYFTDPTTNRTEQRRFDLRVTKDAIHIYVAEGHHRQARGFPFEFYIATSYADGTPASCELQISQPPSDDDDEETPKALPPALQTISTNKYGVAKVTGLKVPTSNEYEGSASLYFTARDSSGKVGHHTESFYYSYSDSPVVRVETDKALYGPGEPIKVSIATSKPEMNMIVDVARESNIVESRLVQVHGGVATFTLPYRSELQDEVTISAYSKSPDDSDRYDFPFGSRTVLYPRDRDLQLSVRLDHSTYKPGEDALADFRILTSNGRPATSALGVVVFDRAVEERARTDQEFGGSFGFYGSYSRWRRYDDQVGGVTRKDLERIDLTKPLPEGMELVAELILGANSSRPQFFSANNFETNHATVFAGMISRQIKPVEDLLNTQYKSSGVYPVNDETFRRLLFESGLDFGRLKDPWDTPYRDAFSTSREDDFLDLISAGPDKQFGTRDDFSVARIARQYFRFTGEAIDRAVQRFHSRTGGFIRDAATLKSELQREGINFDALRDPWGQPYDLGFTINKTRFTLIVSSSGPDKHFEEPGPKNDDFMLWMTSIDYLAETRARIEKALSEYFRTTSDLPHNDTELNEALARSGIDQNGLQDPWGQRYYAVYKTESRYADRVTIQDYSSYGQKPKERTEITPVTQQVNFIYLHSSGEDGKEGTSDDFEVADFSRLTAEQSSHDQMPVQPANQVFFSGAKGAIKGVVTDRNGAAVPGAKVTATTKDTSRVFEAKTDDEGKFILQNLPVGFYEVRCEAPGFKKTVVTNVPVSSSNITTVNLTVEPGTISETVTVSGGQDSHLDVSSTAVASNIVEGRTRVFVNNPIQTITPRLREYFPETLVWQPSLETDAKGRAQLKFKLADNITTWKMSVIGSTEDGEIGTAETEIKAFQPFFVEHDPPRVLTEGDVISLPVVLRNYLERSQTVDLELKPESWFTLLGPAHQRANVAAGESARETFDLKAVASVKDGKQRVTATGSEASDAIEKPVTVHPDGEQKTQTASEVFGDATTLDVNLPGFTIPGSVEAELKFYPSLMAHVVESIEGILERPYGCGEQTISSTYPSLLLLHHYKLADAQSLSANASNLRARAQRYAQLGYQRLLNYRAEDGGFTYWGRGEADLALTAYALRFLHDAGEFVSVDEDVVKAARQWLVKQQKADGSWAAYEYYSKQTENQRRTALLTAFVARVLAMTDPLIKIDGTASAKQQPLKSVSLELQRALAYLSTKIEEIDEPYLIASYALAAIEAGDVSRAMPAIVRLRALAHTEGDMTYWSLETNTPFYGWGLAGRVETTALVVQALARIEVTAPTNDPLVRGGLLFLLKQKDRYGVWYSTQATINVLDTLVTLLATTPDQQNPGTETSVEIIVNGQFATSVKLPPGDQTAALIRAKLSRFLRDGANRIELRRAAGSPFASVQMVTNYYVPWSASSATQNSGTRTEEASALRLTAMFDKNEAKINDEIVCHVKAERVGFRGYGMMLAEIGLPPGAEVDRASLENAMKSSDWGLSQYDVLPDRVVVYLWPRAGGVDFNFKFRPRFALTAKTAPSVIYDYYNPEARAVVAPTTFTVR